METLSVTILVCSNSVDKYDFVHSTIRRLLPWAVVESAIRSNDHGLDYARITMNWFGVMSETEMPDSYLNDRMEIIYMTTKLMSFCIQRWINRTMEVNND